MKINNPEDIIVGAVCVLFFTVILAIVYSLHTKEMKMIEAGYVKQPEMWVKP